MNFSNLKITDPELYERIDAFINDEVVNESGMTLDDKNRHLGILACLMGCQGIDAFVDILIDTLDAKILTPIEIKELIYQGIDYLGIGRVYPFLDITNEIMEDKGIELPLVGQATTTMENRLEKGAQAQVDIFGEQMRDFWKGGHINRWLAANCFGDFYTRKGLDLKEREMITLCFLIAQGGCESQVHSHIMGNMNVGNSPEFLTKLISQCMPYIGYPRTLNALASLRKVVE